MLTPSNVPVLSHKFSYFLKKKNKANNIKFLGLYLSYCSKKDKNLI